MVCREIFEIFLFPRFVLVDSSQAVTPKDVRHAVVSARRFWFTPDSVGCTWGARRSAQTDSSVVLADGRRWIDGTEKSLTVHLKRVGLEKLLVAVGMTGVVAHVCRGHLGDVQRAVIPKVLPARERRGKQSSWLIERAGGLFATRVLEAGNEQFQYKCKKPAVCTTTRWTCFISQGNVCTRS